MAYRLEKREGIREEPEREQKKGGGKPGQLWSLKDR